MFKKKPNIPPWPKRPTLEQIEEDIANSPQNDVAYSRLQKNSHHDQIPVGDAEVSKLGDSTDVSPETVFIKVRNFVEANSELEKMMDKLSVQKECLQLSEMELKQLAEDIKKQALDALK